MRGETRVVETKDEEGKRMLRDARVFQDARVESETDGRTWKRKRRKSEMGEGCGEKGKEE